MVYGGGGYGAGVGAGVGGGVCGGDCAGVDAGVWGGGGVGYIKLQLFRLVMIHGGMSACSGGGLTL